MYGNIAGEMLAGPPRVTQWDRPPATSWATLSFSPSNQLISAMPMCTQSPRRQASSHCQVCATSWRMRVDKLSYSSNVIDGRCLGRDGTGRDGTGRDGTGRDGTGRDGTGRDATRRDATRRDATRRDATRRDGTGRDGTGRDGTGRDGTREDRRGQERRGEERRGEDRKQDRTGQDRTGQDRTGQDRTGQDRTGQDKIKPTDKISVGLSAWISVQIIVVYSNVHSVGFCCIL